MNSITLKGENFLKAQSRKKLTFVLRNFKKLQDIFQNLILKTSSKSIIYILYPNFLFKVK